MKIVALKENNSKNKDHVKKFFNEHAETYQHHLKEYHSGWRVFINRHFVRFFGDLNGFLLDLGSGNSWYYDEDRYKKVIFLDYAVNMLKTRKRRENFIFLNADASCIPLRDNSVELILINSCLHHLARRTLRETDQSVLLCLKECARVLKRGGKILIFEGHVPYIVERIYKLAFPVLLSLIRFLDKPMVRPLSRTDLLRFIKESSLVIVNSERIIPDCKLSIAGCILGNNRFLLNPKFYPWKFYAYLLTK